MVCFVCAGMHRAPALSYDLMDAEYSVSAPAENKTPPSTSVNQCTPDKSRPMTTKNADAYRKIKTIFRIFALLILLFACMPAEISTQRESTVVEEG